MADTRNHPILTYLRQVLGAPTRGGVTDAALLSRFVAERDEAAFELILWRHAGMVLHVCRQVLGEGDAAEDAFQASFLVFVHKAASISRRESLGGWLYRVAYRIALKARAEVKQRASADVELDRLEAPAEADSAEQRELRRMICEEVNRLPAKYRAPIVACYFEGKTHEEAAQQLGWPRGTVAGRLARARELLRRRLVRRGVTLMMGAFAAALSVRTAQAALAGLIDSTIQTAKLFAAGQSASAAVSPRIAALAEGVLKTMYWTRVKIVAVVVLIVSLGGAGAAFWGTERSEDEKPGASSPRAGGAEAAQPEDAAKLARNMARSRLNLKQLALAMHNYSGTYRGMLPLAATTDKNGKALLSWRVALLPYLEENGLYRQFKLDEPWDSPHNKKLLSKMPAVFAPPGVKTRQPYSTFYQVFVSAAPVGRGGGGGAGGLTGGAGSAGAPGGSAPTAGRGAGGPPGGSAPTAGGGTGGPPGGSAPMAAGAPGGNWATAVFVKGQAVRFPMHITDGTSNTILIVEAGNPVPWTKPEDLHYAADEPLPELGGLFRDVIQTAFADGSVHILTKKYDEATLRHFITCNDGEVADLAKIEVPGREQLLEIEELRQQLRLEGERMQALVRINENLREALEKAKRSDEQLNRLLDEKQRLLEDMLREIKRARKGEPPRPQKPVQRKGP